MYTKTTALMLVPILFASCVVDADTQSASSPLGSSSNVPDLQSPEPIIYLADNLDEQDRLGYCIDTDGKGFSNTLQVHSCKPNGDDVLFYYDAETEQICSATYPGYCAAMIGGPQVGMTIGLAPVVGIPLPFFSYGGSGLWSFTILLFILLAIDAHRKLDLGRG